MPEGDTIYRAARTLHRALAGRTVTSFASMFPALTRVHEDHPLTGRQIEQVSAVGKHVLMVFSGGLVLRTHMRMNGSWHIYRPGERWLRPRRDMRIEIGTDRFVAVGFRIPVAEFVPARRLAQHEELHALGPDLLADSFDREEALHRMRAQPDQAIADVLLNQRVIAGIGNVFKSEALFAARIHPSRTARQLSDDQLSALLDIALEQLRASVVESPHGAARRTTRRHNPAERLWVYGRGGRPCRRCGTPISVRKDGPHARLTYWCRQCQPDKWPIGDV